MPKRIIGFAGRKRGGKTTLARHIAGITDKSRVIAVASYLKKLCADILGVDIDTLNTLKDNGQNFSKTFTDDDIRMISERTGITQENILGELSEKTFSTVREMLQIIGTDVIRKYNPNWHVECLRSEIEGLDDGYTVLIDDVRFKNEVDMIRILGGTVYFIIRPLCFDISNHSSETAISWMDFMPSRIIVNDKDVSYLTDEFEKIYKDQSYHSNMLVSSHTEYLDDVNPHIGYFKYKDENPSLYDSESLDFILSQSNSESYRNDGVFTLNVIEKNKYKLKKIYNPLIMENIKYYLT